MKNYLIKIRYGINFIKTKFLISKLLLKRKNIFISKIYIINYFVYNIKIKKNFFIFKNYFFLKILIICGGDGSYINIFKKFFNKKIFIKFLNFGNLGFLSNNNLKQNFLTNFNIGNILIYENIIKFSLIFLNEIIIKKKNIKIKIKNNIYIAELILISTNFGSTGYLFSNKKIQFKLNYLSIMLVSAHTNKNFIIFFKKIKIKIITSINIIIDFNQNFFLKNVVLIILYKIKKNILQNLKIKIYDK